MSGAGGGLPGGGAPGAGNLFVVLLPTLECNLRCGYCFEDHPASRWDLDRTGRVFEQVFSLAAARKVPQVMLHWQGGEPLLMGRDYWKAVLPLAAELAGAARVELRQSMQTNLIAYRSEFAPLVKAHLEGTLGTSFDLTEKRFGPGVSAQRFRFLWTQAHHRAVADGLEVGVLCLLDDDGIALGFRRYVEILREEYGIRKVRFTLPFSTEGNADTGLWADPEGAGRFLAEGFRLWHANGGNQWMEIRPFGHLEARMAGDLSQEAGLCFFCPNCADLALSIGPGGQVALCDNFAGPATSCHYGNLSEKTLVEIFGGSERGAVRRTVASLSSSERCSLCRYLPHCHGGCLARCLPAPPDTPPEFHYCDTYRALFKAVESTLLQ